MSRIPHPVVSALTRSQMKSGLGGEEVNTSTAKSADATTTAGARKRKLTPIPVPPWEMAKQPRKAAEAAKRFIKQVATGKEPSRNAGPKTTITSKPKGGKRVQWSEGLGKSQSGSDFAEFVRQKAIELEQLGSAGNAEKDSVVGTAGTADNWEQFKGLIKPAVGEYVKLLQRSVRRRLTEKEGLWFKGDCVVVPDAGTLRQQIVAAHHDSVAGGHFGVAKAYYNMCKGYWWPGMKHTVETYVRQCHQCQTNKSSNTKPGGLLHSLPVPSRKWESIGMDFITQLPCTKNEHDSILVVVDRLSKLVHFIPTHTEVDATEVAQLFVQHVAKHHGLPESIVSDRDSKFTSKFWQAVMKLWGVKTDMTTSFHPQGNAQHDRKVTNFRNLRI